MLGVSIGARVLDYSNGVRIQYYDVRAHYIHDSTFL